MQTSALEHFKVRLSSRGRMSILPELIGVLPDAIATVSHVSPSHFVIYATHDCQVYLLLEDFEVQY